MLFYCLNLVSMKMAITIIHYLLLKYYKYDEHKQIQYFNTFGNIHYLCYYINNLEDFKTKLKFAEKSQIDLYQKILDILEVPDLFLNVNKLSQKKNFFIKNKNFTQKIRVSTLLSDIRELKIEKQIFVLIEFFCDFIQYEDIEQRVINGSENDEYSTLIEIKELLEQKELEKNHLYVQDLSVKKFYKNKLESTFNKFFFENNKIKTVKNKIFKYSKENKKNLGKNKINLISFFHNWNMEYKKGDEISTKNCLIVDNITKGKRNINIRNKIKNTKSYKNYKENINNNLSKEKDSINKENNFVKNIFMNRNMKNSLNNKFNIEHNLYYKTESNNINSSRNKFKIRENNFLEKINPRFLGMFSSKNLFKSRIQNQNNFKFISNYFDSHKFAKKNSEEINKSKFVKTFLLKNSINIRKNKPNKSLEEKRRSFSNNKRSNNKKEKEMPYININALRLYDKKKVIKKKFKTNDLFDDDLLVEKYNQARQSSIIRKIIENKNKLFQKRLQNTRNIIPFNK